MSAQTATEATKLDNSIELSIQTLLKSKAIEYAIQNGRMHNAQSKLNELTAMINSGEPPPWANKHLKLMLMNAANQADKISLLTISFQEELEKRKINFNLLQLSYNDRIKNVLLEILSIGTPRDYKRKATEIPPANNILLKAKWETYSAYFNNQLTETLIEFAIRQSKHAKAKAEKLAAKKKPIQMEIDTNPQINTLNQKVAELEKKIKQLSINQPKPKPLPKKRVQTSKQKGKAIAVVTRSNANSQKTKNVKRNVKRK